MRSPQRVLIIAVLAQLLALLHNIEESESFSIKKEVLWTARSSFYPTKHMTNCPLFNSKLSQSGRDKNMSNHGPLPPRKRDMARAMLLRVLTPVTLLRASVTKLCDQSRLLTVRTILINTLLIGFMFKEVMPISLTPLPTQKAPVEVAYSRFMDYCEDKKNLQDQHIDDVQVEGSKITFRLVRAETRAQRASLRRMKQQKHNHVQQLPGTDDLTTESAYTQAMDGTNSELIHFLRKNDIPFRATATMKAVSKQGGDFPTTLAVVGGAFYLYKNGGFPSKNGKKTKAPVASISFDDIEGIDDAKHDVLELVDTLRNPEKYRLVGARAPTGLLLEGLPGTGKTTLARAAASLADVPLIYCSGSEFVEKYVGTGAARVRELFSKAEKINGPCIIFIDEIDAMGKARGGGGSGSGNSDESEQTLIQLLSCMDGLGSSSKICVLGATNRRDVLDPALVRPGRFDRIIKVNLPSMAGRERILRIKAKKLLGFTEGFGVDEDRGTSLGKGKAVDLSAVARVTDGLSGAELEMIVNEAAIRAVRRVSIQLNKGIGENLVDTTVYPQDFEASVESFFQSRNQNKPSKQFGFDVERSTVPASPAGIFYSL